jgi:hypothetical protein
MEAHTTELFQPFEARRTHREASEADQQDEADLKALESQIQRRPKP